MRRKVIRPILLFIMNHFLVGTHFFAVKRILLCASDIKMGKGSKVVAPLQIGRVASLEIGDNCWIGKNLLIDGNGTVRIGSNVDIAPQVTFATGGHMVGLSCRRAGKGIIAHQKVGDGSWIGTHTVILGEIEIGEGCVVAGGSVVIERVPDNTLVAGVPAQVKKALAEK